MARRTDIPNITEHGEQAALIEMCDWTGYPYNLIYAVPNGGKRDKREAARLKAEGVRAGMLDLVLPLARVRPSGGIWCGLYLELKVGRNTTSPEQDEWIEKLTAEGYRCEVRYYCDPAWRLLQEYVRLDPIYIKGRCLLYESIKG